MDKLNAGFKVAVIGLAIIVGGWISVKAILLVGQFFGVQAIHTQGLQNHESVLGNHEGRIQKIEEFLNKVTQQ